MLEEKLRLRSFMFLPAHNRKFIEKAIASKADALILDMEDAVPPTCRKEARANIREFNETAFEKRKNIFIRINPINTEDFVKDISCLTLSCIDGFMLTKIETAEDIRFVDRLLTFYEVKRDLIKGKYKLAPLIETTRAVENISEIAGASDRLVALCLGGEDYLNDLGSVYTYQQSALYYPRAALVNAARANHLLPIDTPYLNVKDIEGFRENEALAYRNGFAGCLILSPRQIEAANQVFMPDEEKIDLSRRVIDAVKKAEESGTSGVAVLDGVMVGPPMRKRAETVVNQVDVL